MYIQSKANSKEYEDGWDRIFGKDKNGHYKEFKDGSYKRLEKPKSKKEKKP